VKGAFDIRYVCLSDLHLGEEDSLLTGVGRTGASDPLWGPVPVLESLVARLADLIGDQEERPTLILLGDALELALATDNLAAMAFERFVRLTMHRRRLFDRIIYVPGNHDHHVWESAREAQYVQNYLLGDEPVPNQPLGAFLEPSWHTSRMFVLEKPQRTVDAALIRALVQRFPGLEDVPVQAAYPHLALRTRASTRTIIFHHGHLLEELYRLMGLLRQLLFREEELELRLDDIESLNFAWIDFFWSTLGRSGSLGTHLETLYETLNQCPERLTEYADNVAAGLASRYDVPLVPGDRLEEQALRGALRVVLKLAGAARDGQRRLSGEPYDEKLREAIVAHLTGPVRRALVDECLVSSPFGYAARVPDDITFVMGHTHKPFSTAEHVQLGAPRTLARRAQQQDGWVKLYNLGGWVVDTMQPEPSHGAAVLLVDDGLNAVSLRLYQEGDGAGVRVDECLRPGEERSAFGSHIAMRVARRYGEWRDWTRTVEVERGRRAERLRRRLEESRPSGPAREAPEAAPEGPAAAARLVTANGVELFTESFGDADDPAVLLIMGAMASGVWWPDEFCRRLARGGRFVVRYDQRDTGRSTSYAPGTLSYSLEDLADDAVAVLDAYGVGEAHLAGMSLGGILAQIVAIKHPGRVRSLTLVASERHAPADPELPPISPEILAYHVEAVDLDWSDRAAVIEYQVGAWRLLSGPAHAFDEEGVRARAEADFEHTPNPLTAFNHAQLGGGEQYYGRLAEIVVPALVIHGSDDPVLPYAHGVALAEALPDADLLTLEGVGHELHPDDWQTIVDAILALTEDHEHKS